MTTPIAPSARTFYKQTITLTFYADKPFNPEEGVSDLLERDSIYGTRSGWPPLTCLEESATTKTITGPELATVLLGYECVDAEYAEECSRLSVFDLTGTGADTK
jgi:hypothetical protein